MTQRKKFTPELKAQVALEIISGVKSAADACREWAKIFSCDNKTSYYGIKE